MDIPVVVDENCPDMFSTGQAEVEMPDEDQEEEEMSDNTFEQLVHDKQNYKLKDYLSQSQPFDMIPEESSVQGAESFVSDMLDDLKNQDHE